MNLNCYVIDDEPAALGVLGDYITQTPGLTLIGKTTDPLSGLEFISGANDVALTFLDIDMPQLSGLALAGLISFKTLVIFTTAFREYGADAFEKDAVDFLHKPFGYERFLKSVQKAQKLIDHRPKAAENSSPASTLFIKTGIKGQLRGIQVNEIIHAAAALNYVEIYLKDDKVITYLKLDDMTEKLPAGQFSRIHKSHLVNHEAIQTMEYAQIRLKDKTVLPIGRTFRKAFREKMNEFLLISKRDHPA